jgi:hypothetical protein
MSAPIQTTDIMDMELNDNLFAPDQAAAGFRKIVQFLRAAQEPNPPEWERPGQQIVITYRTLGWYAKEELVPAPGDHGNRRIYCALNRTQEGQVNRGTKLGKMLEAMQVVFGSGLRLKSIRGRICWTEETVLQFGGTRKQDTAIESKPVPVPIGIPTAQELRVVQHLIVPEADLDRVALEDVLPAAGAEPELPGDEAPPLTLSDSEVEELIVLFDNRSNQQVKLAVLSKDCELSPELKQAVLRDQVVELLVGLGRLTYSGGVYSSLPF